MQKHMNLSLLFFTLAVAFVAAVMLYLSAGGALIVWLLGAWVLSAPLLLLIASHAVTADETAGNVDDVEEVRSYELLTVIQTAPDRRPDKNEKAVLKKI